MSYQPQTITISRRALAVTPTATINSVAIVGTCTGVVGGQRLTAGSSNLQNTTVGQGPGVGPAATAASQCLAAGGTNIVIFGCNIDSAAALSSVNVMPLARIDGVTPGTGYSHANTITISGTPNDGGMLIIEALSTTDGSAANTVFRYSWDDGFSWVETFITSSTYALLLRTGTNSAVIGTSGLTITLTQTAAGSYVVGDRYGINVGVPRISTSSYTIANAISAIAADAVDYNFVYIANAGQGNTFSPRTTDTTNLTNTNTDFASLKTGVETTLFNVGRPAQGVMGTQKMTMSTIYVSGYGASSISMDESGTASYATAFLTSVASTLTTVSDRLFASVGQVLLQANGNYCAWTPSSLLGIYRNIQNGNPRYSIYRTADGAFTNIVEPGRLDLRYSAASLQRYDGPLQYGSTFDERETSGGTNQGLMSPAGFGTLTTDTSGPEPKAANFYFTAGNAKTFNGSDFFEWQRSILMDVFIRVLSNAVFLLKGQDFETKLDGSGQLSNNAKNTIESTLHHAIKDTMVQNKWIRDMVAPLKFVSVGQSNNFVSDSTIYVTGRLPAPQYGKFFVLNLAFTL